MYLHFCTALVQSSHRTLSAKMDMEYINSSTLVSLLGESTTTEKSNSDFVNETIQTFQKVISTKDMVRQIARANPCDYLNVLVRFSLNSVLHFC